MPDESRLLCSFRSREDVAPKGTIVFLLHRFDRVHAVQCVALVDTLLGYGLRPYLMRLTGIKYGGSASKSTYFKKARRKPMDGDIFAFQVAPLLDRCFLDESLRPTQTLVIVKMLHYDANRTHRSPIRRLRA